MVQKELRKISQRFWKGFLKWYDGGEKMGSHRKGFLKLKRLSPPKMVTSPLFEETFGAFFSFSLFLSLSLEDLEVLMIFEEKITSSKTSFQMVSIYWRWMHILE
jgi:hypothetical protein